MRVRLHMIQKNYDQIIETFDISIDIFRITLCQQKIEKRTLKWVQIETC